MNIRQRLAAAKKLKYFFSVAYYNKAPLHVLNLLHEERIQWKIANESIGFGK